MLAACVLGADAVAAVPPTDKDRRMGAIMGALVADAAVMPLHWIYNQTEIAVLAAGKPPEFFNPPSCPCVCLQSGLSPPMHSTAGVVDSIHTRAHCACIRFPPGQQLARD